MNYDKIVNILIDREGYAPERARIVASECEKLSPELLKLFNKWLNDPNEKLDYVTQGYSLSEMINKRELKYPAALLDMDWLIKEPTKARPVIDSFMAGKNTNE